MIEVGQTNDYPEYTYSQQVPRYACVGYIGLHMHVVDAYGA